MPENLEVDEKVTTFAHVNETSRDGAEVARWAHNPKVVGSNPAPATKQEKSKMASLFCFIHINLLSHPLKSQFLRDIVLTHYLAYFLEHAPKSFHCSFEVIGRCRQKNVHSISHHTFIKVAAQSVI